MENRTSRIIITLDDNYRITYISPAGSRILPEASVGDLCCKALGHKEQPCAACPLRHLSIGEGGGCPTVSHFIAFRLTDGKGEPYFLLECMDEEEKNLIRSRIRLAERLDPMTGLNKKEFFLSEAERILREDSREFFIAYSDIEHFKLYNDWHGFDNGNRLIVSYASFIKEKIKKENGTACYLGADDFLMLLPGGKEAARRLVIEVKNWADRHELSLNFIPALGLYYVTDRSISPEVMCDRAALALSSTKGDFFIRSAWYDEGMMQQLQREQELLADVKYAIDQREFSVYLQPKCNMNNGKIVGAEALVRWKSPYKGMISPGDFVPVLEKEGLIYQVDRYVWEDVCRHQRELIDKGIEPLPVSVNVSRVDIHQDDIPQFIFFLTLKYGIPTNLIEIEITESAYMSDFDFLVQVVKKFRSLGFAVLMDDFGSGYSSLNMLKDIDFEVIKIDMKFLEVSTETRKKGGSILESVVRMARWLGYRVIAEGTETKSQVDFLLSLGCQYGQGYYFYRPMPYEDYDKLMADESMLDREGIKPIKLTEIQLTELFQKDVVSEKMLDNIMGGVALYGLKDNRLTLLRANRQYYEVTGRSSAEVMAAPDKIIEYVAPDERHIFMEALGRARSNGSEGASCTVQLRRTSDGKDMWAFCRVFFLRESKDGSFFYVSVYDSTAEKLAEQALAVSKRQLERTNRELSILVENIPAGYFKLDFDADRTISYCSQNFLKIIGLSREELREKYNDRLINIIHPDDRESVISAMKEQHPSIQFRILTPEGIKTVDSRAKMVNEYGKCYACCLIQDVTVDVELRERQRIILENTPGDIFRECAGKVEYFSCRLGAVLGYTKQEYQNLQATMEIIYDGDKAALKEKLYQARKSKKDFSAIFRMVCKDGSLRWVNVAVKCQTEDNNTVYYGLLTDADEAVMLRTGVSAMLDSVSGDMIKLYLDKEKGFRQKSIRGSLGVCLGYKNEEEYAENLAELGDAFFHPFDLKKMRDQAAVCCETHQPLELEMRCLRHDGNYAWVKYTAFYSSVNNKGQAIYDGAAVYISRLKNTESELQLSRRRLMSIIHQVKMNVWEYDVRRKFFRIVDQSGSITRVLPELSTGIPGFPESVISEGIVAWQHEYKFLKYFRDLAAGMRVEPIQIKLFAQQKWVWVELTGESITGQDGQVVIATGALIDISIQKQLEEQTQKDPLTGLYHRGTVIERIKQVLRDGISIGLTAALVIFDFDNFRQVNETYGHAAGDRVLVKCTKMLRSCFRERDIMGRLGGDEFLVLCENLGKTVLDKKIEDIREKVAKIAAEEKVGSITFSVGAAVFPDDGDDFDQLYKQADAALFRAKGAIREGHSDNGKIDDVSDN